MSECVVGMEMPKSCPCELAGGYDIPLPCFAGHGIPKRCKEFDECVEKGTKPDWCPIICQLPEGHGPLVSEKDVRWAIDDIVLEIAERIGHVPMTKNETMEYVNQLPTIVPAERSET